jgi:PAS domain S-box-containing protein
MDDRAITREQLLDELAQLRCRVAELEAGAAEQRRAIQQQAEEELRHARQELEARVQQPTAELASAVEELKQERYLLHTLMDYLPHNIYFKDALSRFIRINRAMANLFGLKDTAEAIGHSDLDFFSGEHALQALADEREILRTGRPILDKEEKETWFDGHETWVVTTKMPLYDEAGRIVGTFGVSRDITEQKMAAVALRAAKEAAEAASRAKSIFLANMSHEIRTPLNAIIGIAELMLDAPLAQDQREYLTLVLESGESLLTIINDLLDFSKIEAGKFRLDHASFNLAESLGDTMKSLAIRAHHKGLELAYHLRPDVPIALVGDGPRLRQVVINLVGNAIKFTDQGEVVLDVSCQSAADHAVVLHFAVTDTGIGVPEDKRAAIFEAFEQADGSTTRRYGGTGLGLSIASRLVEMMGGQLQVESEVGRGSTFHFTAQFDLAEENVLAARPPCNTGILHDLRVLVVDDNHTNRLILHELLQNWGMQPTSVASAAEAIQVIDAAHRAGKPYRLVLTDANMPDTDGFALAERIKREPQLEGTVIMMLSSGDRPTEMTRCDLLGIAAYLMKPVKQSELFDAVLVALGVTTLHDADAALAVERSVRIRPLRILLAEDSIVNQKLVVGLLRRQGHMVTIANHGKEALAIWSVRPFDMVLMDVQMPEMDGLETALAIRAREKQLGRHTPIIAMTAYAMKGDRQRCLEAGMDCYIAKPIRAKQLFDTMEQALGLGTPPEGPASASGCPDDGVRWSDAMEAVNGDEHLLKIVVQAALEESPRLVAAIRQAIEDRDPTALRLSAHTLKGSIRCFGDGPLVDCVFRLEKLGQEANLEDAAEAFAALEGRMVGLCGALEGYLRRSEAS